MSRSKGRPAVLTQEEQGQLLGLNKIKRINPRLAAEIFGCSKSTIYKFYAKHKEELSRGNNEYN
jgi:hypothetical protein